MPLLEIKNLTVSFDTSAGLFKAVEGIDRPETGWGEPADINDPRNPMRGATDADIETGAGEIGAVASGTADPGTGADEVVKVKSMATQEIGLNEALEVFRDTRATMIADSGIEPGRDLCRIDEAGRHFGMRVREEIREV